MGIEQIITRMCNQTAVYWGSPVPNGTGGFTYGDPVEIQCRWENVEEVIRRNNGEEIISGAQVYVLQDVDEQGYLYLGELTDSGLDSAPIPTEVDNSFQILKFEKTPALNSTTDYLRKAYLKTLIGG